MSTLSFDGDGWSTCRKYYIRTSFNQREQEDVFKAFYRPDSTTVDELTDWTWCRDLCVESCQRDADLRAAAK